MLTPTKTKFIIELTGTTDPAQQLIALEELYESTSNEYMSALLQLAPKDLTAYCEYIFPDEPPADWHVFMLNKLTDLSQGMHSRLMISAPPGHAKAMVLDTKVPTPLGYKTIAELKVGDKVYGPDGTTTKIIAKSPVFENRTIYRVYTDDGQAVLVDGEHLWTVRLDRKRDYWKTYPTEYLANRTSPRRAKLPNFEAVEYKARTIPLDPYVLGYWLGDGHSDQPTITCDVKDQPEVRERIEWCGVHTSDHTTKTAFGLLGIRKHLVSLGVLNNKHVPELYLRNSYHVRLSILQGLMDSDGTVSPSGQCSFCSTNSRLRDAVSELLFSLGVKNSIIPGRAMLNGKDCGEYWRVSFYFKSAFQLWRKVCRATEFEGKYGRYISFEKIEGTQSTQCITVEREDGLFLVGRGHIVTHNSTYASRLFPTWKMGVAPKTKYLQAGHSQNFVENEFGKKCRDIIESDRYAEVFPNIQLSTASRAAGYWVLNNGSAYLTRGVGQGIAGFRTNLAGVDDPFASREDAESDTIRNKTYAWFKADYLTRLLPKAPLFIVATRWHSDDLCGRLEAENKMIKAGMVDGAPWEIINLPAIYLDDSVPDPIGRQFGDPLWPEFFSKDVLAQIKSEQSAKDWNSLYMGKPIDEQGGVIKREWFTSTRYRIGPERKDVKRRVMSVDTANKNNERAAYTVATIWDETKDNHHYLIEVYRKRVEFFEMANKLNKLAELRDVDCVLVEDKGSGTQYIQQQSDPNSPHCPRAVIAISTDNATKEFRMDGVTPMMEAHLVHLPENSGWLAEYEAEIFGWPETKYKDQGDSTSQYLAWARPKRKYGTKRLTGVGYAGSRNYNEKARKEVEAKLQELTEDRKDSEGAGTLSDSQAGTLPNPKDGTLPKSIVAGRNYIGLPPVRNLIGGLEQIQKEIAARGFEEPTIMTAIFRGRPLR
jgi:predicted phage terminase large subunit-like protein